MKKRKMFKSFEKRKTLSLNLCFGTYYKDYTFSIFLINDWGSIKYTPWIPRINECDYSYWNWCWLCFSIHIDKKGSEK